jgi:hypothetical protein
MLDSTHAYTAGLIDGEGSIMLCRLSKNQAYRYPFVSVTSTTLALCEFLKTNYNGYICTKKLYAKHHKQAWHWNVSSNAALDMIKLIRPYMLEPSKVRRIDLLLAKYKILTPANGYYTSEQHLAKLAFEEEFLAS